MITTEDLRFVVQMASCQNLAELSRKLDVTASAVSQRLSNIEQRAGMRLAVRVPHLSLTAEGEMIADRGRLVLADLEDLQTDLDAQREHIAGKLRVVAPLSFGRAYVAPIISEFCHDHPVVSVDLLLSDAPVSESGDAFDLIVHIGDLPDSELIRHRLAPNKRLLCAAPGYLARVGGPLSPDDLHRHDCIAIRENNEDVTMWRLKRGDQTAHIRIKPRYSTNDGGAAVAWAVDGRGIILRSEWDVGPHIKAGQLVRVLPEYEAPDADIVALLGHRFGRAARTTAFLEALKGRMAPVPWR